MDVSLSRKDLSRRRFVQLLMAAGIGTALASCGGEEPVAPVQRPATESSLPAADQAYLAVARGEEPRAITRAALAALGGIERFVKSGHDVIVKPNICVDYRSYEYGATTNPEVVAALVELCLGAGARRVRVMDLPFGGSPESAVRVYAPTRVSAQIPA